VQNLQKIQTFLSVSVTWQWGRACWQKTWIHRRRDEATEGEIRYQRTSQEKRQRENLAAELKGEWTSQTPATDH